MVRGEGGCRCATANTLGRTPERADSGSWQALPTVVNLTFNGPANDIAAALVDGLIPQSARDVVREVGGFRKRPQTPTHPGRHRPWLG